MSAFCDPESESTDIPADIPADYPTDIPADLNKVSKEWFQKKALERKNETSPKGLGVGVFCFLL